MTKRVKFIANPAAGNGARKKIEKARKYLCDAGIEVDLTITTGRGEAEKAAAKAKNGDYDRILAAGGDGTMNEVINGLAPSHIPLGFLPLGTTNVLALELAIPFDVEKSCHIFLHGETRTVNTGDAGGRRFLMMASAGIDAEAVYRVSLILKRWTGKLAYIISMLQVFSQGRSRLISLTRDDGTVVEGNTVIISNGKLYGGAFPIAPDANLEESLLDVCVFKKIQLLNLIKNLLRVARGKELRASDVVRFKVESVLVEGQNVPVQLDGDYCGQLPMRFLACPNELRLIVPSPAGEIARTATGE